MVSESLIPTLVFLGAIPSAIPFSQPWDQWFSCVPAPETPGTFLGLAERWSGWDWGDLGGWEQGRLNPEQTLPEKKKQTEKDPEGSRGKRRQEFLLTHPFVS